MALKNCKIKLKRKTPKKSNFQIKRAPIAGAIASA